MRKLTKAQFDVLSRTLKKDGQLTTSGVLEMAKDKNSPLHGLFQWDNEKAADEYRKIQARTIIKRYNVSEPDLGKQIVHVPSIKRGDGVYKETEIVVNNVSDFEMALDEALSRLKAAKLSVSRLHEVAQKESQDTTGVLAVVMQSLNAATIALDKIH